MQANNIGDTRNRIAGITITEGTPVTAGTPATTGTPATARAPAAAGMLVKKVCQPQQRYKQQQGYS
jgi:hypothetical protein